jgi:hypothetical protein
MRLKETMMRNITSGQINSLKLTRTSLLAGLFAVFGILGGTSALAQGVPLNVADNPVDLLGNYHAPGAGGNVKATTDPGLRAPGQQVVENSGGIFAKDGTFTPFNDEYKQPANLAVDFAGRAFQFEVDFNGADPSVRLENTTFAAGLGNGVGDFNAVGQVEFSPSINGYAIGWRNGAILTPIVADTAAGQTQFRVRVVFDSNGTSAVVVITPINGPPELAFDTVSGSLAVFASTSTAPFAAGFYSAGNPNSSRGHAILNSFLTTAGRNHMWMLSPNPYRSTNPSSWTSAQTPTLYTIGEANPTVRVHAWQAITQSINGAYGGANFNFGLPVFDTVMINPFNGSIDINGRIRSGAFSVNANPTGTDESSYLVQHTFGLLSNENAQRPSFFAVDPNGGISPAISTLQGSGFLPIATTLREASAVVTDNTIPNVNQLKVIQDGVSTPPIVHQGDFTLMFRAEDFGLQPGLGTGLARYPRAVLRPSGNSSVASGVQSGDIDISNMIYPKDDQMFTARINVGTPGTPMEVTCGNYRVVAWAQDRVGLFSLPRVTGNPTNGYDGVSPVFEIRKFNSLTLNISMPGFAGSAPDPIHASPARYQRWMTIKIGGAPSASGSTAPQVYERLVLVDGNGNGTFTLNASDRLPCPGNAMWVSVKDQQHTLRKSVPIVLTPNTSDYRANVALTLGDLNNDNRVGIVDFGVFLSKYGVIYTQNDITYAGPNVLVHADLSGNRRVGFEDYLFVQNNNNVVGDADLGNFSSMSMPIGPQKSDRVSVKTLLANGVREARRYDFNRDGWVTWQEMQLVLKMKSGNRW